MIDLNWSEMAGRAESASDAFEDMFSRAREWGQPLSGSGKYTMTRQMRIDLTGRGLGGFTFRARSRGQLEFDLTSVQNEVPVLITSNDNIPGADMQAYLELMGIKFYTNFDGPAVQIADPAAGDHVNSLNADIIVINHADSAGAALVEINHLYGGDVKISGTGGEAAPLVQDIFFQTKNHPLQGTRGIVCRNMQMVKLHALVSGCTNGIEFIDGTSTTNVISGSVEICANDIVMTSGYPKSNDFQGLQVNARDYAFTSQIGAMNTVRRSVNNNSPGGKFLHPTQLVGLTIE